MILHCHSPGLNTWTTRPFVGRTPQTRGSWKLMRVSAAHVYLTHPFVLSWPMLEAMSAGDRLAHQPRRGNDRGWPQRCIA